MSTRWWRRLMARMTRDRLDSDLQDEMQFHLDQRCADFERAGLPPDQARRAALRQFGNVQRLREDTREVWSFIRVESVLQDLRFALRTLRRQPAFTTIAILILSLSIGANTAMFTVVNTTLFGWANVFPESDRLVMVWQTGEGGLWTPTPGDFRDWQTGQAVFQALSVYHFDNVTIVDGPEPERLAAARVTVNFFEMLGVRAAIGRSFAPDEERWGRHAVAVVSHRLWTTKYGSDRAILGRSLIIDGNPVTVIGVMPPGAWFGAARPDLWLPFAFAPDDPDATTRHSHYINVVARLRDGVTLDQANAEMTALARRLEREHPENQGLGARVELLRGRVLGSVEPMLQVLSVAVGLVLLIGCANLANLLLVRGAGRQREMAVRSSLGAGRARVMRLLVIESLVLSALGAALGVLLATWATGAAARHLPEALPRVHETGLPVDARVLTFAALLTLATALLFGVAPALRATRGRLTAVCREGARGVAGGRRQQRAQRVLVGVEVALALVLLVGAGLSIRSLVALQRIETGTRPSSLLTMRVALPLRLASEDYAGTRAFYDELLARVQALPGVRLAGVTSHRPFGGGGQSKYFGVEGHPPPPSLDRVPTVSTRQESARSMQSMGVRLVKGRFFTERDTVDAPRVAIVNETLARRFFAGEDPVGRFIRLDPPEHLATAGYRDGLGATFVRWQVVGVVADVRYRPPMFPPESVVHVPYLQRTRAEGMGWAPEFLVVHSEADPLLLVAAIRHEVSVVRRGQAVSDVRTIEELTHAAVQQPRFTMAALAAFAAVAAALAALGIYGVVSYAVTQRVHEIGVRMALGADRGTVVAMIAGETLRTCLAGLLIGLTGAFALTRFMAATLYGIAPRDPATFTATAVFLAAIAMIAALVPAVRAARVNPATALRAD